MNNPRIRRFSSADIFYYNQDSDETTINEPIKNVIRTIRRHRNDEDQKYFYDLLCNSSDD